MNPPKIDRSVQLNESQTLPCETICGLIALWVWEEQSSALAWGSYIAICSSGIFERF